ncbi:hypothetical protein [Nocardia wallacei]|uniref:hypothetical protein n=1 Tax=Nocardia wallacei TaxID=480035 RepID=UPI0024543CF1|nr:hypothetical protein [Nocardia wallacei]
MAVGLLCLPLIDDIGTAVRDLGYIASSNGRQLADTLRYRPGDDWLPQLSNMIAYERAITVVVLNEEHCAGEEMAITGFGVTITTPGRTLTYLSVRGGFPA